MLGRRIEERGYLYSYLHGEACGEKRGRPTDRPTYRLCLSFSFRKNTSGQARVYGVELDEGGEKRTGESRAHSVVPIHMKVSAQGRDGLSISAMWRE
jgi:hypothetical protein